MSWPKIGLDVTPGSSINVSLIQVIFSLRVINDSDLGKPKIFVLERRFH
jgi:hypothetical protein